MNFKEITDAMGAKHIIDVNNTALLTKKVWEAGQTKDFHYLAYQGESYKIPKTVFDELRNYMLGDIETVEVKSNNDLKEVVETPNN